MDFCISSSFRNYKVRTSNGQTHEGLYVDHSMQVRHWAKISTQQEKSANNNYFIKTSLSHQEKLTTQLSSDNEESDSSSQGTKSNHNTNNTKIISLILHFIMWLYLVCGISRKNCWKARDMLVHIIQLLPPKSHHSQINTSSVPCDICTISKKLKLDFTIDQHVCC
ncbi:hypothetical protein O181_003866 [Austropuccinia psidii MF-1]|uniref:Uncharacterized protein n=1 Tax=Austropuccinia psidii MF-1 TaxID=1389203 RepID=A0A9Q3BFS6_9BASI|nr:hypothetical protein [Austropuccinia psidii MF-1]